MGLAKLFRQRRDERAAPPFQGVPVLGTLTPHEQRALEPMVESCVVPAGRLVAVGGETLRWVVFVADGELAPDGVHGDTISAGAVFGAAEAVLHAVAPATVRAVVDTSVVMIDRRRFMAALSTYPAFATGVLRLVAADARAAATPSRRRRFEPRRTSGRLAWAS
jgi:CRP-like cAMP-binding protein